MRYWLMKSEPDEYGIDHLMRSVNKTTPWFGVRNYVARNFMRDSMRIGDGVLFYHSSCEIPGIAGFAKVASKPYPDASQFDRKSPYFDAKSTRETPRWLNVDVRLVRTTPLLTLQAMRNAPALASMRMLQRGNRLSITPVTPKEWRSVLELLESALASIGRSM